jgi:hypothetical protein
MRQSVIGQFQIIQLETIPLAGRIALRVASEKAK